MNHVIVTTDKKTGETKVYTSLAGFLEKNTGYKADTINNYITRKKVPYESEALRLVRCEVIGRK